MGFDNFPSASSISYRSNTIAIRLSAYLWAHLFPIALYALIGFSICMSRFVERTGEYYSADLAIPWDDGATPFYAAHVADLHHTNIRPERMILNHRKLGNITYRFNPPVLSLGGDLIDALNSTNILSFHKQYEVNWHRYNTTRIEASLYDENRTIFELAGNHDMMVVSEDNDEKNRYRHYTMKPGDPLAVRSYQFDHGEYSTPINVILFNILRPPYTSGPLGVFPCAHDDDVQKLEDSLKRGYRNIIITHFPFSHWWSLATTTRGNGLRDVGHLANMALTGHLHPATNMIERKDSMLSVIVTALFDSSVITMPFVDNGGAGVQPVDTTDPNDVVLITYPLAKDQVTSKTVFNLNTFPIRCFQFAPGPNPNLSAYIDGKLVGNMVFLRTVRRHVQFYSLNVTVDDGDHVLKVGATEIKFFVGDKVPPTVVVGNNNLFCPEICIYGAFRTLFFLLLLLLPLWKLDKSGVLDRYKSYIYGNDEHDYKWYVQIFLGPYYLITRARFLPKNFYYMFWILVTLFLVFPMYVMQDDQYLAVVFVWGAWIHNTFSHYAMCFVLWLIHLFFFCQGLLVAISYWYEVQIPFTTAQWVEFVLYLIVALGGSVGWWVLSFLAGGFFTTLTAPITWVQVAAAVYTALHLRKEYKEKNGGGESAMYSGRNGGIEYGRGNVNSLSLNSISTESSMSSIYTQDPLLIRPLI